MLEEAARASHEERFLGDAPTHVDEPWHRSPSDTDSGLLGGALKSAKVDPHAASLLGQFTSGVVLIIAVAVLDAASTTNWGYGISVGAVGAGFALVSLGVLSHGCGVASPEQILCAVPVLGDVSVSGALALLLCIWWNAGTYVLTFQGPFLDTGNGYFAASIGLMCSIASVTMTLPRFKATSASPASSTSLVILGVCAFVVGLALGTDPLDGLARQAMYGMVVAVLTLAVVLVTLLLELHQTPLDANVARSLHTTVMVLWGIAAFWLTFTGPFTYTGNGYFSLWIGFACASRLVLDMQSRLERALANETLAAMWGQLVAAVVLILAAAALPPSTENWGFALTVGIVAAAFSFAAALLSGSPKGTRVLCFACDGGGGLTLNEVLALLLFVWWGVGTGILTIHGPYTRTGNAYFGAWLGFACSVLGVGLSVSRTRVAATSGVLSQVILGVCSLLLLLSAAPLVANQSDPGSGSGPGVDFHRYKAQLVYTLVLACFSIVHVLITLQALRRGKSPRGPTERLVALVRFVLWTILAAWCTTSGPADFTEPGNAYFAAWTGVVLSALLMLMACMPQLPSLRTATRGGEEQQGGGDVVGAPTGGDPAWETVTVSAPEAPSSAPPSSALPATTQPLHAVLVAQPTIEEEAEVPPVD